MYVYTPFQFSHTPLILPLSSLQQYVKVRVFLLQCLDRLQRGSLCKLRLERLYLRL